MSISICLTCCSDPMLGVYILMTVTSSLLDDYVISFFVSFNIYFSKWSYVNIATPALISIYMD